jgi:hypothetical protein
MKASLIALLGSLTLAAPFAIAAEPTAEQKAFVQTITVLGRLQAACSLYNNELLHPGVAKKFIESQLKSLPAGEANTMRSEVTKQDPKCAKALN